MHKSGFLNGKRRESRSQVVHLLREKEIKKEQFKIFQVLESHIQVLELPSRRSRLVYHKTKT